MARYVFIQIMFFVLPFVLFAFWRLARRNIEDSKKAWPLNMLFVSGITLGIAAWVVIIMFQPKTEREECTAPARMVDGVLVPAQDVPCDDLRIVETEATGSGSAQGFSGSESGVLQTIEERRENPVDPNPDPDLIDLERDDAEPDEAEPGEGDGR